MLIRHLHAERNSVRVRACECARARVCAGDSISRSASLFSAVHQSVSLLRGLGARRDSVRSQDWSRSLDQWSNFFSFCFLFCWICQFTLPLFCSAQRVHAWRLCECVCVCACANTTQRLHGNQIFILGTRHVEEAHIMQIALGNYRFLKSYSNSTVQVTSCPRL